MQQVIFLSRINKISDYSTRIENQIQSLFTSKCDLGDLLPLALGQLELLELEGERHGTWHGGGRQATDCM